MNYTVKDGDIVEIWYTNPDTGSTHLLNGKIIYVDSRPTTDNPIVGVRVDNLPYLEALRKYYIPEKITDEELEERVKSWRPAITDPLHRPPLTQEEIEKIVESTIQKVQERYRKERPFQSDLVRVTYIPFNPGDKVKVVLPEGETKKERRDRYGSDGPGWFTSMDSYVGRIGEIKDISGDRARVLYKDEDGICMWEFYLSDLRPV